MRIMRPGRVQKGRNPKPETWTVREGFDFVVACPRHDTNW
jgi:hypothetical protein